uniref:Uncharacterized protein n=1 Tax=Parascaris univalens TaxID=6257 RepID=A0A915BWN3_PARUN
LLLLSGVVTGVISMATDPNGVNESDNLNAVLVDRHRISNVVLRYKRSGPRNSWHQNNVWNTNKSLLYMAIVAIVLLSMVAAFIRIICLLCARRKKSELQIGNGCSRDSISSSCSTISG